MNKILGFRKALGLIVLLSVLATSASFYMQYVDGMNPCVLCILQRVSVMAVGLTALTALLWTHSRLGRLVAAVWVSLPAVYGAGVAVYQLYLQSLPAGTAPSCGAPWTFRLRDWPLFDYWEVVVRGFGDCAVADYVVGVPLPVWSVGYFGVILTLVWLAWYRWR